MWKKRIRLAIRGPKIGAQEHQNVLFMSVLWCAVSLIVLLLLTRKFWKLWIWGLNPFLPRCLHPCSVQYCDYMYLKYVF